MGYTRTSENCRTTTEFILTYAEIIALMAAAGIDIGGCNTECLDLTVRNAEGDDTKLGTGIIDPENRLVISFVTRTNIITLDPTDAENPMATLFGCATVVATGSIP